MYSVVEKAWVLKLEASGFLLRLYLLLVVWFIAKKFNLSVWTLRALKGFKIQI